MIEAERHVPGLPGEDHYDRRDLQAGVAAGEQTNQCEHQAGHEAEDRDALQDVEERNENSLRNQILRRPISIRQREQQRADIGEQSARQRIEDVRRKRRRSEINVDRGPEFAPLAREREDAKNRADKSGEKEEVEPSDAAEALQKCCCVAPRFLRLHARIKAQTWRCPQQTLPQSLRRRRSAWGENWAGCA